MDRQPPDDQYAEVASLVRLAQAGDRGAFDRLVERYRDAIWATAFVRTNDRDAAEDLAQEIFTRAWRKLSSLQDPLVFVAWLRAVAANACLDWYRKAARTDALPYDEARLNLYYPPPLEEILAREQRRAWRQALLSLPDSMRVPLVMHVFRECSYQEIADFLDVSVNTIGARIHRARKQLKRLLDSEEV